LAQCRLPVAGALCLDLGQSTGGFTDCLLQAGARHVVGVDVGRGQLDLRLRDDARVGCLEQVNARHLTVDDVRAGLPAEERERDFDGFDLIVGDLAFISQTLVLPAAVPLLKPGGHVLMLVKPQFELQPGQVGKGGIVTDQGLHAVVEQRVRAAHQALGLRVAAYFASSIHGGDGNREFFIHSTHAQE
jgi:23S rRNA (cytidine1920-2'-O)/16S rRNA (cytidine1409-2'-O)-methyltransferase